MSLLPHGTIAPVRAVAVPSASAMRASASAAGGLLLALPWRLASPPILASVAIWLAVVVLARSAAGTGEGSADAEHRDRLLAPLMAMILAGLVRPIAGALVASGWLAARALEKRPGAVAAGMRDALRDIAVPALGAWLAFGGDRGLDAGAVAGSAGSLPVAAWVAANAAALGSIAGWSAVLGAAPRDDERLAGLRPAAAAIGWCAALGSAVAAGSVGASLAALVIGMGMWSGPAVAGAGRARWQALASAGLLATAAGLALGR